MRPRDEFHKVVDNDTAEISLEEFVNAANDMEKLFIVGMAERPGTDLFMTTLELKYFPPHTELNDQIDMYACCWNGLPWGVISLPLAKEKIALSIADETEMRVVRGFPTFISFDPISILVTWSWKDKLPENALPFPLKGDNVRTLENARNSPIYDGLDSQKQVRNTAKENLKKAYNRFRSQVN